MSPTVTKKVVGDVHCVFRAPLQQCSTFLMAGSSLQDGVLRPPQGLMRPQPDLGTSRLVPPRVIPEVAGIAPT
jgi:hypothetical protein